MAMPSRYEVIHPPVQNTLGAGMHTLHTPQSIFQHMMGQHNVPPPPPPPPTPPHQSTSSPVSAPWPQMPQVPPMMMPWCIPNVQQSQLVRFTGKKQQPDYPLRVKRKMDIPDITETHRAKQFITEEKMAAHFQDMHISNNYSQSGVPSTSDGVCEPQPCCSTSSDGTCIDVDLDPVATSVENGKSMHPRLVISDELKRLRQEPLLPASLLSKLERPSMALVLWEPPSKHLRMLSTRQSLQQFSTIATDNNENNNNSGSNVTDNNNSSTNNNLEDIPDMNQSLMEGPSNIELEPMDL